MTFSRALSMFVSLRIGIGIGVALCAGLSPTPLQAFVGAIEVVPSSPTADDEIQINVSGDLPTPCWSITGDDVQRTGSSIRVEILMQSSQLACVQVIVPYSLTVALGKLAPGAYDVTVSDAQTSKSIRFEVAGEPIEPRKSNFVRGNANDDNKVDLADAITVLGYLFDGSRNPTCLEALDANDDSKADLSDAIYLLSYFFLGGPAPDAPFPACGPDGDEDPLTCEEASNCA